ncbi:hypothetical protein SAMD00019534_112050 [Acytostelium subglobosum LB1]|uniref:hypothetical protein n=1 Tax=Acytostelium subglobosum LB1 TaxID=1410327 RepID=UPI0006449DA0|nr:hypothetical protein SAMD00019534_112050 [Acytostelium subglobosum LB1]GAM28029.1 hypothetical protein SAMD00019534_112050 [Acytostelium subglobosum LB1]|eukprot:XP_012748988.1 hypothetical protein SAMD00019534_112050 [Acytostelium subglobosum LB1]
MPSSTANSLSTTFKALQLPLAMPTGTDFQNSAAESFQQLVQQSAFPNYQQYYNTAPSMDNSVCEVTSTISPSNLINTVHHQLINHHLQQQQQPMSTQQQIQQQHNQGQMQQHNQLQQHQQHQQLQQHQQQQQQQPMYFKGNLIYLPQGQQNQQQQPQQSIYNLAQQMGGGITPNNAMTTSTTTTQSTTLPIYIPQHTTSTSSPPTLQTAGGQHLINPQNQQLQQSPFTTELINGSAEEQVNYMGVPVLKTTPFPLTTSLLPLATNQSLVLIGDVDISIEQQPPSDVRTRTPNDRRTFNCVIRVIGDYAKNNVTMVLAQLAYANSHTERPTQDILGGNKLVPVGKDGKVVFDSLSMTEASTKHQENEFCLEYILLTDDNKRFILPSGMPFIKRSRPFYAYSNQKVLSRRRNVTLRTLSLTKGSTIGGEQMHVVGSPFIRCNSLRCIFHTPHGDIPANNIELYSESVLFFTLPPYPSPPNFSPPDGTELPVQVVITNDGRNYSNPLPFTYIFESSGTKRLRSRF